MAKKQINDDAAKLTRAYKDIERALREIEKAADELGEMIAYYDERDVFHTSTVEKYNHLITAAQILDEARKI